MLAVRNTARPRQVAATSMISRPDTDLRDLRTFQIAAFDGLRGLAALIVVLSHTSNSGFYLLPGADFGGIGKSGVFLFFVLSAFLLTRPLLGVGWGALRPAQLGVFALRRVLRIYPLYALYLLAAVVTTLYAVPSVAGRPTPLPFPLDWTAFWRQMSLQDGFGVTWSIVVEFKFYFVLPFLATGMGVLLARGGRAWAVAGLAGVAVALAVWRRVSGAEFELLATLSYAELFLVGCLGAVLSAREIGAGWRRLAGVAAAVAGVAYLLTIPSLHSALVAEVAFSHFHEAILLFSAIWFAVVMWAQFDGPLAKALFANPPMRHLGDISFSLYLLHVPVLTVMQRLELGSALSAWLVLGVSVALSTVSYRLVERPLFRLGRRRAQQTPGVVGTPQPVTP